MVKIKEIMAREILDSRGNPTVEAEVILDDGTRATASVPSGASRGEREALELRDNDERFFGKGVQKAVKNIKEIISPNLAGKDPLRQYEIDKILIELDGSKEKKKLGANAILAVSLAVARTAATYLKIPLFRYLGGITNYLLPIPLMNLINGGKHADNNLEIQEFMIVPRGFNTFTRALQAGVEVFHTLRKMLKEKGCVTSVGDEGGFAPDLKNNQEAIELLIKAIETAGYRSGEQIFIALDVAASSIYENGYYIINGQKLTSQALMEFYGELIENYPIISIEDPFDENDWGIWKQFSERFKERIQIVGDDLFVTNVSLLQKGIRENVANAILIKVNQIGTLSETIETINLARSAGYNTIISHRSGETEDTFISHLAVATNAGQIKTGSLSRSERNAKYNELLRIEEYLDNNAIYMGKLWQEQGVKNYCIR